MPNTTTSPNMNLPVPTVGVDDGPDWATNYNACMSAIDSHSHTVGQGVQITPDGLNINADLPINNNNVTTARTLRFQPQTITPAAASDLGCLTEVGVDLYYIDGNGIAIRITQSGSVSGSTGTITGLPSGTASASFSAGTFTFQSSTNTPASLSVGPTTIGQAVASGFGVTISAANAQASNYAMTLPSALPGATQFVTLDSSGNIAASIPIAGGIGTSNIADGSVTNAKLAASSYNANTVASFTTTSGSFSNAVTTVLSGATGNRLVRVSTGSASSTLTTYIEVIGANNATFQVTRNGTVIGTYILGPGVYPGNFEFIDQSPAVGTNTYVFRLHSVGISGNSVTLNNFTIFAVEL